MKEAKAEESRKTVGVCSHMNIIYESKRKWMAVGMGAQAKRADAIAIGNEMQDESFACSSPPKGVIARVALMCTHSMHSDRKVAIDWVQLLVLLRAEALWRGVCWASRLACSIAYCLFRFVSLRSRVFSASFTSAKCCCCFSLTCCNSILVYLWTLCSAWFLLANRRRLQKQIKTALQY